MVDKMNDLQPKGRKPATSHQPSVIGHQTAWGYNQQVGLIT